jgi:hypothetical protein
MNWEQLERTVITELTTQVSWDSISSEVYELDSDERYFAELSLAHQLYAEFRGWA